MAIQCPKCKSKNVTLVLNGPYVIESCHVNDNGSFNPEDAEPVDWPDYFSIKEVHCSDCEETSDTQVDTGKVIGVVLVALMMNEAGEEENIPLHEVPKDQASKLEEHLLLYELMKHVDLAKEKLSDWEPIVRAIDRAAALVP